MPMVVALWPNMTASFVWMPKGFSAVDLYHELDQEDDPVFTRCYVVAKDSVGLQVTLDTDFESTKRQSTGSSDEGPKYLRLGVSPGRKKRYQWPRTIYRDYLRSFYRAARATVGRETVVEWHKADVNEMPTPPEPRFLAKDVRSMQPFSGVYIAWNEDGTPHYVGESRNVPSRVSSSRPEIGDRMIGVLACHEHERRRIEAWFIGLLNPPGNAQSTHRMSSAVGGDDA